MPADLWDKIKRISGRNYRSLNSQFIKIVEDWLDDRDYLKETGISISNFELKKERHVYDHAYPPDIYTLKCKINLD